MFKKLAFLAVAAVFLAPSMILISIGVLMNPAANASCTTTLGDGSVVVGNVPDSLTATTANGERITLNKVQLTRAAQIIQVGNTIKGVGRDGIQIALMAALTESSLRMLANTSAYPESASYPHDGDGSDHDSLGLFQMRPQSGWGSVGQLMDATYQVKAFFGGPAGPNYPSPRGLLDIPGWQAMSKGEAAQSVEVSAYPDRYSNYEPVAAAILDALAKPAGGNGTASNAAAVPESSRVVFPLPEGTWVESSPFGPRVHPITGQPSFHTGVDLAAPAGTAILAAADGVVTVAGPASGYGNLIVVEHTIDGQTVATAYGHMYADGIHVHVGDKVTAGQHIGDVGSAGNSTGPHLHFEVRPGGTNSKAVDPAAWLNQHGAANLPAASSDGSDQSGCRSDTAAQAGDPSPVQGDPDRLVDDPTSNGKITARMANLMAQTKQAFPNTSWGCWSPRPGTTSDHPLGKACDVTFGNQIGTRPTPAQLEAGWQVVNWLKDHAQVLGVNYLIWQGKIWSLARDSEGWRPYNGGGMYDPHDVTGGHYDHCHISVN